jgi:hypothetical protein
LRPTPNLEDQVPVFMSLVPLTGWPSCSPKQRIPFPSPREMQKKVNNISRNKVVIITERFYNSSPTEQHPLQQLRVFLLLSYANASYLSLSTVPLILYEVAYRVIASQIDLYPFWSKHVLLTSASNIEQALTLSFSVLLHSYFT